MRIVNVENKFEYMSNDIAVRIEHLGKMYRLGEVGTGTISHDLNRWIARIRGKEDPFTKIGEINDRTSKSESEYVWALRDITFDIRKGDVVGIIGRNGAGKSTLLKLLSKVTKPTTGRININGRIASLLEVGTGFHPEMTGRENIFLNGAIMGMTKREIKAKFDEIVDFAGVERYVDTPVKRYSSGMYVRLAFAVAAHLEPEILIVDEVLAVGDNEFQKRCLGKMKDVSERDGRTVLFVSHNMGAISNLCNSCLYLRNGTFVNYGDTDKIISEYMKSSNDSGGISEDDSPAFPGQRVKIRKVRVTDESGNTVSEITNNQSVYAELTADVLIEDRGYDIYFELSHLQYGILFRSTLKDTRPDSYDNYILREGRYVFRIPLPLNFLRGGAYSIKAAATIPNKQYLDMFKWETPFTIIDVMSPIAITGEDRWGSIVPVLEWEEMSVENHKENVNI